MDSTPSELSLFDSSSVFRPRRGLLEPGETKLWTLDCSSFVEEAIFFCNDFQPLESSLESFPEEDLRDALARLPPPSLWAEEAGMSRDALLKLLLTLASTEEALFDDCFGDSLLDKLVEERSGIFEATTLLDDFESFWRDRDIDLDRRRPGAGDLEPLRRGSGDFEPCRLVGVLGAL